MRIVAIAACVLLASGAAQAQVVWDRAAIIKGYPAWKGERYVLAALPKPTSPARAIHVVNGVAVMELRDIGVARRERQAQPAGPGAHPDSGRGRDHLFPQHPGRAYQRVASAGEGAVRSLVAFALLLAGCAARPDPGFDAAFAEAVPICELRAHPELWLGKSVLVRGRYTSNDHGSGLWLEECPNAWTDLRGSAAVTEDPKAARILNRLAGWRRNEPNETVYRGVLRSEPRVTGPGSEIFEHRFWFEIERLVAAKKI